MKYIIIAALFLAFTTQKKVKFEFTVEETEIIYQALGKMPAEQVEALRAKIRAEFQKQMSDSTKK